MEKTKDNLFFLEVSGFVGNQRINKKFYDFFKFLDFAHCEKLEDLAIEQGVINEKELDNYYGSVEFIGDEF